MAETPGIGIMLGAAGPCPEIPFGGKVWKVGHPTQRAKAELEKLAVAAALDEVRALKGVVPTDAYREMFAEVTSQITNREFRTWGPAWQRAVFAPANAHLFLCSLLRECHPQATPADALALAQGCPEEVAAALAQVVPNFLRVLLEGLPLTPEQREKAEAAMGALAPNPVTTSN